MENGYRETLVALQDRFGGKMAITVAETAAVLGVSEWTVRQDLKRKYGKPLPSRRVGKNRIVIPLSGLARWMCDSAR